jgi:hypothetical protein
MRFFTLTGIHFDRKRHSRLFSKRRITALPIASFRIRLRVMPDRTLHLPQPFGAAALAAILLSMFLLLTAGAALSQTSPAAPAPTQPTAQQAAPHPAPSPSASGQPASGQPALGQATPTPAPTPPAKPENPGLIGELGKLLHKLPTLKSPSETIEDMNARAKDATKGATETLTNLARPSSMTSGRMICPASANGAPDCKAAADRLCQAKGYKEGKSLTMDSAEKCSAKVLIPGRTRKPDDCHTDNYVTAALCQ